MRFFPQGVKYAFFVSLCVLGPVQLHATSEESALTQRMTQMSYPDTLRNNLETLYPEDREKVMALFGQAPEVETVLLERARSFLGRIGDSLGTTGYLPLGAYVYDPRHETRLLLKMAVAPGLFEGEARARNKYALELFKMPGGKVDLVLAHPAYFRDVLRDEPWLIQGICDGYSLERLRMSAEAGEKGSFHTDLVSYYGKESNKYLGPMFGAFCLMMFVALVSCSGDGYSSSLYGVDPGY